MLAAGGSREGGGVQVLRNSLVGRAVHDVPRAVTRGAQGDRDGLRPVGALPPQRRCGPS